MSKLWPRQANKIPQGSKQEAGLGGKYRATLLKVQSSLHYKMPFRLDRGGGVDWWIPKPNIDFDTEKYF